LHDTLQTYPHLHVTRKLCSSVTTSVLQHGGHEMRVATKRMIEAINTNYGKHHPMLKVPLTADELALFYKWLIWCKQKMRVRSSWTKLKMRSESHAQYDSCNSMENRNLLHTVFDPLC
jgi:uncharacterized protein YceK